MIAERSLAQAVHAWGAQAVPFSDQPNRTLPHRIDRAGHCLLNQSAALRVMPLAGRTEW
jgi:hypothetical protein